MRGNGSDMGRGGGWEKGGGGREGRRGFDESSGRMEEGDGKGKERVKKD